LYRVNELIKAGKDLQWHPGGNQKRGKKKNSNSRRNEMARFGGFGEGNPLFLTNGKEEKKILQ